MITPSTLLKSILLCVILCAAFYIRIQSTTVIPEGHFTSVDAYFYYWQAALISEHGQLPARDLHRWLPVGRDSGQTLNLYGYVLAYTDKSLAWIFPNITLYQVCFYMPVVCFCIGLGVLCFFLYHSHGLLFSGIVGILLATLPGAINRSTAGFSDRDAFCLMIGLLAVVTYLASVQVETPRKRLLWTLASGFIAFLGGLSWEGFGVFLSVIIVVELWRFLTSETEEGLGFYTVWVCCFVPELYLASPAYRNGYGFAEHLFALVLVPPLLLLVIRTIRHLLLSKSEKRRPHVRTVSLGLTLISIALCLGYLYLQWDTFSDTTVPLSQNALMQSLGELKNIDSHYWMTLFGYIFVMGIFGIMISVLHLWKNQGIVLVFSISFFSLTLFFREYPDHLWGAQKSDTLFFLAVIGTAITFLLMACRRDERPKKELASVAAFTWFLIWTALARDAERYSFFSAPAIAFFCAEFIQFCQAKLWKVKRIEKRSGQMPQPILKTSIALAMLAFLVWLPSPYGYAWRTLLASKHLHRSVPPYKTVAETFGWMKAELSNTAVVATDYIYGSQLNVLGDVKTITDQDTFIQYWIHLYYRYLFCGQSEKEVLQFLKTHGATHLMLTEVDIVKSAHAYSKIGRYADQTPTFEIVAFQPVTRENEHLFLFPRKETPIFKNIEMNISTETETPATAIAIGENGSRTNIPYVVYRGKKRNLSNTQDGSKIGGIILYFDESDHFQKGYYVPPIAWNNFTIRLFLRGVPSDAFKPVYEVQETGETDVKVWEIHYPADIQADPKYLKTGFPEIDKTLGLP